MPYQECSIMSQREEFCRLALTPGANVSELWRRFGVGRTAGSTARPGSTKNPAAGSRRGSGCLVPPFGGGAQVPP
jgi:hypothetical protein